MSSTRTAPMNSPLTQERWASSPALERGLKANLVALRNSILESARERELVWLLQYLSLTPGRLAWAAKTLGVDVDAARAMCLDPELDLRPFIPALEKLYSEWRKKKAAGIVVTEIGRRIEEALDYCRKSKCLVVVSGEARTGKSYAAENYCAQHAGAFRLVPVPSHADDLSWFSAIARALGITIESNAKTKNLRPRIEAALQSGDLVLVLDSAENCFPGHNYRLARPPRICWLMELVNQNVPVLCIVTRDFARLQHEHEKRTGWSSAQWVGRIERFVQLPETLSDSDLESVARWWLPTGDRRSIEVLRDYASLSTRQRLAAIKHTVKQAQHLAEQRGMKAPTFAELSHVVKESIANSEPALAAVLGRREATAPRPRARGGRLAVKEFTAITHPALCAAGVG